MEMIVEVRRRPGCRILVLADGRTLTVPYALFHERPMAADRAFDYVGYCLYMQEREYPHALDRAVKLLSSRDRSEKEIDDCLKTCGYSEPCRRAVMEKLYEHRLVDDERYAENFARGRVRKMGQGRIKQELSRRGVDSDIIENVMQEQDEEDMLAGAAVLAKKALRRAKNKEPRLAVQSAIQALARRGYSYDTAKKAVALAQQEEE